MDGSPILEPGLRRIQTAKPFLPFLDYHRYKGAHGGRGGGKSWFFASNMIERHILAKTDSVCLREVQKSLQFSAKKLLEETVQYMNAGLYFDVQDKLIKDTHGGIIIFNGMNDLNAESIKSLESFDIAWFEEAQSASESSLRLLRPTLRKPKSELWFSWNRVKEDDPIEVLLCGDEIPEDAVVIEVNLDDNPFAEPELFQERENDRRIYKFDQDKFLNTWYGKYLKNTEGDYYKNELSIMKDTNRICRIPVLEIPVNTFWDIGNSDGCAVWLHQKVGLEHRMIGYMEDRGKTLGHYAGKLKERKYQDGRPLIFNKHFLPHDAEHKRLSDTNKSTKEMLEDQGLVNIEIVPVIQTLQRGIDITRKNFASLYIDKDESGENGCKLGLKRLTNYRKKYSSRDNRWLDEPNKANGCSECADALRQWAQAEELGMVTTGASTPNFLVDRGAPDWRL